MSDLVFYYHNRLPCTAFAILEAAIKEHGEHEIISTFDEFRVDQYVLADSSTSRIIAIDFDNTITADPDFYLSLIQRYRESSWEPIVCTLRDDMDDNLLEIRERLQGDGMRIYTTDGRKKRAFMLHQGISVGLWIDDYFPAITQFGTPLLIRNGIEY
ncbi:hypothetical protein SAMN05660964_02693 [Thiothrix caldifontis]|jgi:Phage derived protein Gp49-like (DUF891).|uniref:Uncharacterized protein n=1 Tax=Thiothrix caldifontis TaxID=525918 RepID=A0A1H4EQK8_9GAMM|nr:hypothetical protein [Thiothrix caldifontis]SEA87335.1 hypothetical protein SAMN05660964_02693 [Thiothrix caldifontis]